MSGDVRWTWSWACAHSNSEHCQSCDYDGYWGMTLARSRAVRLEETESAGRWRVWRGRLYTGEVVWIALSPVGEKFDMRHFATHAEALAYALQQAERHNTRSY